jgi:hypothetical protein
MNPLVFSDKSRDIGIVMPRIQISLADTKIIKSDETKGVEARDISIGGKPYAALRSLVAGEIARINEVAEIIKQQKQEGYSEKLISGGSYFFLFPSINNDSEFQRRFLVEGKYNLAAEGIEQAIKAHIETSIRNEVNETLNAWKNLGLVNGMNEFTQLDKNYKESLEYFDKNAGMEVAGISAEVNAQKLIHLATELVINEFVANGGMLQLITDPAEFFKSGETIEEGIRKAYDDVHKRLGGVGGPRARIGAKFDVMIDGKKRVLNHDKIEYIAVNDVYTSRYLEHYKKEFEQDGWSNIVVTDAQEMTTLREHIVTLHGMGRIDDDIFQSIYGKIIQSYKTGGDVTLSKDERIAIIPQKPLYTGHSYNPETGIRTFDYIKSSSLPLIANMTKGTPLDEVRKKMEMLEADKMLNNNKSVKKGESTTTVRLAFVSAIKSGARNINDIFNEDFTIKEEALDNLQTYTLDRKGFGIQQEESKHSELKIYPVSQMNKLLHLNTLNLSGFKLAGQDGEFTGKELKENKELIRKKLVSNAKKKLYNRVKQ